MEILRVATYVCLIAFTLQQMRIASFEDVFNQAKRTIPGLEQMDSAPSPTSSLSPSPASASASASPSPTPSAAP